mmetsp:Transcript_62343/g.103685  ORF Transcript_62343/g.103685 Transcript_62343/m.103685 type:complete len:627 (+) Transcript_62343:42-1922(+)
MEGSIVVKNLWFSYEVSENISATAKVTSKKLMDGGLSIDMPRQQHDSGMQPAYKLQLRDVSMTLPSGSRCILLGANGAGKSTLMSVIGGRHLVDEDAARVLGRPAFHDTTLATDVALLTGNWTHTVSFVGHNVPYQAMEVSRLISSHSGGVDPQRVERLVRLLEVDPKWNLTTVSDGQRRRVQILCKLLKPSKVLLLDEITTDLDLLARQDLLTFLREESEQRGVCTIYCTHIFDGLDSWPTHIAFVSQGKMMFCSEASSLAHMLKIPSEERERGWGSLFCAVRRMLLDEMPRFANMTASLPTSTTPTLPAGPAVAVRDLSWQYGGSAGHSLRSVNFELSRGVRCLLVGANGAGKTTLLKLLGGKHMVPAGQVQVLGYNAFHDTCLNTMVALLSGDWTRQVACVGNGVPFQADFSVGFMAKSFCDALVRDGLAPEVVSSRFERLSQLLDLDLEWRLHKVSDGQRRRAQLLLKLLRPSELLLLDEVTTDLDVLSRQALLHFLREESELRGTTVIYSTHIFDGLDDWPTHVLHMKGGKMAYVGPLNLAPRTDANGSGSLYSTVHSWLDQEREQRRTDALQDVPSTPMQSTTLSTPKSFTSPQDSVKSSSFASKFDRFGGSGRQSMYAR